MITEEIRWAVYMRAHGRCDVCGVVLSWQTGQAAHRVARTKWAIRKWGADCIDHPGNLAWTCPECNDAVLITNRPIEREALMKEIAMEMAEVRR